METLNQILLPIIQVLIPLTVGMFMFRFGWRLFKAFAGYDSYPYYTAPAPKLPTITQAESAFSLAHRIGAATAKRHTLRLGRFRKS